MNYINVYSQLISHAKLRGKVDGYKERHHVIPKALGGDNSENNLVDLTAREHFIAHMLLAKIHGGSMWHAVSMLRGNDGFYLNSRLYEIARKEVAKQVSDRFKGVPKTEETKLKISLSKVGKPQPKEAVEKMRKTLTGRPATGKSLDALHAHRHLAWTPEAQLKKSAALKGRDVSGWIHKVAEANRGRKPPAHVIEAFVKRIKGKKQTPEQVAKRVASRKATLEAQGRTV
jgi:hypothetical protein